MIAIPILSEPSIAAESRYHKEKATEIEKSRLMSLEPRKSHPVSRTPRSSRNPQRRNPHLVTRTSQRYITLFSGYSIIPSAPFSSN